MVTLILIDDQYVHDVVLNFEKTQMVKMTPRMIPTTQQEKFSQQNFPPPPTILEHLYCPFPPKENFLRKLPNISITFVYFLFSITVICFLKNPWSRT